jgi:hypothetical protein
LDSVKPNATIRLAYAGAGTGLASWALWSAEDYYAQHTLGLVFGLGVAYVVNPDTRFKPAAWIVAAFTLSWIAAFRGAMELSNLIDNAIFVGVLAGAAGALIVALGTARAYPMPQGVRSIAAITATGAVFGALLAAPHPAILFISWQTAVSIALGRALTAKGSPA